MSDITKNCNLSMIPCQTKNIDGTNFFRLWLDFLKPYHKLTDQQCNVLSVILTIRYELSKSVKDDSLLDSLLLSQDNRKRILEETGITYNHLGLILNKFREKKILGEGNRIDKKYIPNLEEDSNRYRLILDFKLDEG